MRIRFLIILQFIILTLLISCKASKHLASSNVQGPVLTLSAAEDAYIVSYKDIAVKEMNRTGIPASITLAQGMIESDYGRSSLAKEANNHFGIKCHSDWTGGKVYHNDDRRNECFRKYNKPEDSFIDHSEFLKSGSRYDFLFNLSSTDYKGWAHGLKKAGYATNPDYGNMLIRKIEGKNLHYYDNGYKTAAVPQTKPPFVKESVTVRDTEKIRLPESPVNEKTMVAARVPRVMENNNLRYIIVKDGDTREKLEEEFELLHWELPKYNELNSDFRITPGQILYLQPKREKAEEGKEFYNTTEGDTMYLISQRFGIKLKSLYKLNRMEESGEPVPGSKIWLRNIKPVN
ncbi:MAG: glucosaminidase domain-containing protein [Bacteroidales bacterium]|nr:glucosaminidase domain-containing protein [Bacteroidales bacterium]